MAALFSRQRVVGGGAPLAGDDGAIRSLCHRSISACAFCENVGESICRAAGGSGGIAGGSTTTGGDEAGGTAQPDIGSSGASSVTNWP